MVARRGARRGGERTLRIPPSCSDPVSHACGPHVASFVRESSVCALAIVFLLAGRRGARRNARASRKKEQPTQREAERKKERPAKKRVGTLKKKRRVAGRAAKSEGGGSSAGGLCMKERKRND